jgi:hypothetical protein
MSGALSDERMIDLLDQHERPILRLCGLFHSCLLLVRLVVPDGQWILAIYYALRTRQRILDCCLPFPSCSLYIPIALFVFSGFLLGLFFEPWRWRRHVPRKCYFTFNGLHGVISQKIEPYFHDVEWDNLYKDFEIDNFKFLRRYLPTETVEDHKKSN